MSLRTTVVVRLVQETSSSKADNEEEADAEVGVSVLDDARTIRVVKGKSVDPSSGTARDILFDRAWVSPRAAPCNEEHAQVFKAVGTKPVQVCVNGGKSVIVSYGGSCSGISALLFGTTESSPAGGLVQRTLEAAFKENSEQEAATTSLSSHHKRCIHINCYQLFLGVPYDLLKHPPTTSHNEIPSGLKKKKSRSPAEMSQNSSSYSTSSSSAQEDAESVFGCFTETQCRIRQSGGAEVFVQGLDKVRSYDAPSALTVIEGAHLRRASLPVMENNESTSPGGNARHFSHFFVDLLLVDEVRREESGVLAEEKTVGSLQIVSLAPVESLLESVGPTSTLRRSSSSGGGQISFPPEPSSDSGGGGTTSPIVTAAVRDIAASNAALRRCVAALSTSALQSSQVSRHVPYRDHTLTRILRSGLEGQRHFSLLVALPPPPPPLTTATTQQQERDSPFLDHERLAALRFAEHMSQIPVSAAAAAVRISLPKKKSKKRPQVSPGEAATAVIGGIAALQNQLFGHHLGLVAAVGGSAGAIAAQKKLGNDCSISVTVQEGQESASSTITQSPSESLASLLSSIQGHYAAAESARLASQIAYMGLRKRGEHPDSLSSSHTRDPPLVKPIPGGEASFNGEQDGGAAEQETAGSVKTPAATKNGMPDEDEIDDASSLLNQWEDILALLGQAKANSTNNFQLVVQQSEVVPPPPVVEQPPFPAEIFDGGGTGEGDSGNQNSQSEEEDPGAAARRRLLDDLQKLRHELGQLMEFSYSPSVFPDRAAESQHGQMSRSASSPSSTALFPSGLDLSALQLDVASEPTFESDEDSEDDASVESRREDVYEGAAGEGGWEPGSDGGPEDRAAGGEPGGGSREASVRDGIFARSGRKRDETREKGVRNGDERVVGAFDGRRGRGERESDRRGEMRHMVRQQSRPVSADVSASSGDVDRTSSSESFVSKANSAVAPRYLPAQDEKGLSFTTTNHGAGAAAAASMRRESPRVNTNSIGPDSPDDSKKGEQEDFGEAGRHGIGQNTDTHGQACHLIDVAKSQFPLSLPLQTRGPTRRPYARLSSERSNTSTVTCNTERSESPGAVPRSALNISRTHGAPVPQSPTKFPPVSLDSSHGLLTKDSPRKHEPTRNKTTIEGIGVEIKDRQQPNDTEMRKTSATPCKTRSHNLGQDQEVGKGDFSSKPSVSSDNGSHESSLLSTSPQAAREGLGSQFSNKMFLQTEFEGPIEPLSIPPPAHPVIAPHTPHTSPGSPITSIIREPHRVVKKGRNGQPPRKAEEDSNEASFLRAVQLSRTADAIQIYTETNNSVHVLHDGNNQESSSSAAAPSATVLPRLYLNRETSSDRVKFGGQVSLDCVNFAGRDAVHIAARNGNTELLKWLHDPAQAADFSLVGPNGDTAFHLAAWNGQVEVMKFLFHKVHMDVFTLTEKGESAAHISARRNELDALKWCHLAGFDLFAVDDLRQTPLMHTQRGSQTRVFLEKLEEERDQAAHQSKFRVSVVRSSPQKNRGAAEDQSPDRMYQVDSGYTVGHGSISGC